MNTKKIVSSVVLSTLLLASGCSASPLQREAAQSGKIYVFESDAGGFNTKNFFYDNGEEVVAFDTQFTPEISRKSIEFLRSKTNHPITHVVITHPNPDKFNGISEFQKLGARVISSRATSENMKGVHDYKKYFFVNMAKMFTEETYPKLGSVDFTFDGSYDLRLGNGETIRLMELSHPGVSTNQTVALIPSQSAVMVGDLVHHQAHAWLEGGIVNGKATPTLKGWISDLLELKTILRDAPETMVYGGRGKSVTVDSAVRDQVEYLRKADRIVKKYIKKLGQKKSELQGAKANGHYQALQVQFEKEFPGYDLGYMIQYGIYGLVNSQL